MELILTGRTMRASEAEAAGLVTKVVPAEATLDAALELAGQVASMPPLAVRAAKAAIRAAAEQPLSAGLAAERAAFFELFDTDDQAEGMAAFTDKRVPVWTGRLTALGREEERMERDTPGGSDVGRDIERDLGDEPPATYPRSAPDYLAPIDDTSPVSGHTPAPEASTSADRCARARLGRTHRTSSTRPSARSGRRGSTSARSTATSWSRRGP